MIAGIIGDVIGSVYEGHQWQNKNLSLIQNESQKEFITPLFKDLKWVRKDQSWTDDTLCTLALYDAYINKKDYALTLQELCKKYQSEVIGFGKLFNKWIENPIPYNSYGNGALMRIGFIQKLNVSLLEKKRIAYECTKISHNHSDSYETINNYLVIAQSLKNTQDKDFLIGFLKANKINKTVEDYHNKFAFVGDVKETFYQALVVVKESNNMEEVLINSCYIGGDVDTLACIAANLASEIYPVDEKLKELALKTIQPYEDLNKILIQYEH